MDRDSSRYDRPDMDRPLGEVLSDLIRDGVTLIQQEIALAKTEIRENITRLTRDSVGLIAGVLFAYFGLLVLLAAAVLALALVMPAWAAALIVGGAITLIGLLLVVINLRDIRAAGVMPNKTVETLRGDIEMMKEKFK